jgi:hypothetical protein
VWACQQLGLLCVSSRREGLSMVCAACTEESLHSACGLLCLPALLQAPAGRCPLHTHTGLCQGVQRMVAWWSAQSANAVTVWKHTRGVWHGSFWGSIALKQDGRASLLLLVLNSHHRAVFVGTGGRQRVGLLTLIQATQSFEHTWCMCGCCVRPCLVFC